MKRRAERQALQNAVHYFRGSMHQLQYRAVQWGCKVPDPEPPFKGDPEGLERFLLRVENKFTMEVDGTQPIPK